MDKRKRNRLKPLNKDKLTSESEFTNLKQLSGVTPKEFVLNLDMLVIGKQIGKGSHGKVFLAKDKFTGNQVALKVVDAITEADFNNIKEESNLLFSCDHPNITKCSGILYENNRMFIQMEYMDFGPLSKFIKYKKNIIEKICAYITCQILKGLVYLHKGKHIVHRDMKPSNLLLNSEGEVKIADFGVSGQVKATNDHKKTWIGTALYMSPERIEGKKYDNTSDIWSLGLIVWECAVGHFPYFDKENSQGKLDILKLRSMVVEGDIPRFPDFFSDNLKDFLSKCLQKDMTKRAKSFELIEHPFVKKYINKGNRQFKEWLNLSFEEILLLNSKNK